MIRKLLFCCVTLLGLHVLGANVVWDKITMREADQYRYGWRTEDPSIVAYGWVGLQATGDGNLFVVASAIDLDGGPMIVGGGSATPEPSCGLLLLLGAGLLALRRVRVDECVDMP